MTAAMEALLARLARSPKWPIRQEARVRQTLEVWRGLRENDEPLIRALMKWPDDRPLVIDPLAEKIAAAYGDLLFGKAPIVTPADATDDPLLEALVDGWDGELPAAEETCVSEGEVWWRLSSNPALTVPALTWHSRADVVPLLHGRATLAVAFVSRLERIQGDDNTTVWRHVEVHGAGEVLNTVWRGRADRLGDRLTIDRHPETADIAEEWMHGVPFMLAGRIVNRWGRYPTIGVSIYRGIWTLLLTLNEATTIGRENMRLTAKKRAIVPASAARPRARGLVDPSGVPLLNSGRPVPSIDRGDGVRIPIDPGPASAWDAGEDVLVIDPLDTDDSGSGGSPFKVLEYSFDAAALIAYMEHLVETICMRSDLVPQFIGSGDFGSGNSGTALRVRLLPTVNASEGRGKPWDRELPHIAMCSQLLSAQPRAYGGFGIEGWTQPGAAPDVQRDTVLPEDPNEVAQRHATLKTADLISIRTSLEERYPGREDEWYDEEVGRIYADTASTLPAATTFGTAGGDPAVPPPPAGQQ